MSAAHTPAEQTLKRPERPDVFICYAREDAEFVWGRLVRALEARGKSVWIDRVDIPPAADWRDRIEKGIVAARAFLFVISPDAVRSYECGQELRQAINAQKRLIPILAREVEPDDVAFELKRLNWVELRDDEHFEENVEQLIAALETDLEWTDKHARLSVRAKEWERAGHDTSLLLRGSDLRDARRWLSEAGDHAEAPNAEQRAYILASRHAAIRRRIMLAAGVLVALVISAVFATLAIIRAQQRRTALAQRQLADSRQVAFEASSLHRSRPDLSMLLAVEAWRIAHTQEARSSLLTEQAQLYAGLLPAERFGVLSLAFSPDSRILATATPAQINLWDPLRHVTTASLSPPQFTGDQIAYSPDGRLLASTVLNGVAFSAVASPGHELGAFTRPNLYVRAVAFSPDGRVVATADNNGTVHIVSVPDGRLLKAFRAFSNYTAEVVFDPVDPNTLVAVGDHQTVKVIDLRSGAVIESLPGDNDPIYGVALAVSPDGKLLATAAPHRSATIWTTRGAHLVATLSGNENSLSGISFSPDGRTIATVGGRDAALWDVATGTRLSMLPPLASTLDHVQFSPDGNLLATGSTTDGTVYLWKTEGPILLDPYVQNALAYSHSGKLLAVADGGGTIKLLDAHSHHVQLILTPDPNEPGVGSTTRDVAFSPDDRLIAAVGRNAAWVWNTATGAVVARVPAPNVDFINEVAFSPDGRTVAMAGIPGPIMLYDLTRRRIVERLGARLALDSYERLIFSSDGRRLIAAGVNLEVWSVATGRAVADLSLGDKGLRSIALSPDGFTVAAGYDDGTIALWDLRRRRLAATLSRFGSHLGTVQALAFSPDGRTLASGGVDATIKLWDVRTRELIATLSAHQDSVGAVAFAPDGELASAGNDGATIFWKLDPSAVSRGICQTLRTNLSREDWARYVPNAPYQPVC